MKTLVKGNQKAPQLWGREVFRIQTEDVSRNILIRIVRKSFNDFTLIPATGFWKGVKERSLTIEIVGYPDDFSRIKLLAAKIREVNNQQAVLVSRSPSSVMMIT